MNLQLPCHPYLLFMILTVFLLPQITSNLFEDKPSTLERHFSLISFKAGGSLVQQEKQLDEKVSFDLKTDCGEQPKPRTKDVKIPENFGFSRCEIIGERRNPPGRDDVAGYRCTAIDNSKKVRVDYWCSEHPDCGTLTSDEKKDAPKSYFKGTIVVKVKKVESQQ